MVIPETLTTTFSTYRLNSIIGEGGSGVVYQAYDDSGQEFAIKILKIPESTEKRKRFRNELAFCESTLHKNILKVIDHGTTTYRKMPTIFYVANKYERSLRTLISAKMQPDDVLDWFLQILDGLDHAHARGIIHRDIKPENILIDDALKAPVIGDFGIAHFSESELITFIETNNQDRLANFWYAAPEQKTRGMTVDHRADIFAIGKILNEMFTQKIPEGTGFQTVSSISSKYSFVDQLVNDMLQQNPDSRPNNIFEIKKSILKYTSISGSAENVERMLMGIVPGPVPPINTRTPIRIQKIDYIEGKLIIYLDQAPSSRWISCFNKMERYKAVLGKEPDKFRFNKNYAVIEANESDAKLIVDYFKEWLPVIHQSFLALLEIEAQQQASEQRQSILKDIEEEKKRAFILEQLDY